MSNPKAEPTDNARKDPDEWLSGDDPMTGAQASYLKTLCEQAGMPELFNDNLTKAEVPSGKWLEFSVAHSPIT